MIRCATKEGSGSVSIVEEMHFVCMVLGKYFAYVYSMLSQFILVNHDNN